VEYADMNARNPISNSVRVLPMAS